MHDTFSGILKGKSKQEAQQKQTQAKKKVKWQRGARVKLSSWQVYMYLPRDLKVSLTPVNSYISRETNSLVARLPSKNLLSQLLRKSAASHFSYLKKACKRRLLFKSIIQTY